MNYGTFKNILETMKAREETEDQLYALGIDMANFKNDLFGVVIDLFNEIYPESKGDVAYFCWETDYGLTYEGGARDEFGRVIDFTSIEGLYNYLENRELDAWVLAEPYGKEPYLCAEGHYLGIDFWVYWNGFAPCVYLDVSGIERAYDFLEDEVHGDITYTDTCLPFDSRYIDEVLGWDYNHAGDYDLFSKKGKRWSTQQIIVDIQAAIELLRKKYRKI